MTVAVVIGRVLKALEGLHRGPLVALGIDVLARVGGGREKIQRRGIEDGSVHFHAVLSMSEGRSHSHQGEDLTFGKES